MAHDWQLQANASIVRAQYDDFDQSVNNEIVSYKGNRPTDVPRRTANLWLSKAITDDVRAGAGVRYVDARYADLANNRRAAELYRGGMPPSRGKPCATRRWACN